MQLKVCKVCGQEKSASDFHVAGKLKSGAPRYFSDCKTCHYERVRAWRKANPERAAEIARKSMQAAREAHPETFRARDRERNKEPARKAQALARLAKWSADNAEVLTRVRRLNAAKWTKENAGLVNSRNSSRRARCGVAIAKMYEAWTTAIYDTARDLGLTVDHVIPLNGKYVSGLHVPWNMQLLSLTRNSAKRHTWTPDWA